MNMLRYMNLWLGAELSRSPISSRILPGGQASDAAGVKVFEKRTETSNFIIPTGPQAKDDLAAAFAGMTNPFFNSC